MLPTTPSTPTPTTMPAAALGILLLAGLAAAPPAAQRQVDETRATGSRPEVEVSSLVGSIRILGWDREEVRVSGSLGSGVERLEFEADGNDVEIDVVVPPRRRDDGSATIAADLEVRVPAGATVEVQTLAAGVTVEGVTGELEIDSVGGDVSVSGGPREVAAVSTGGNVRIVTTPRTTRQIEAHTVSGSILVEAGEVELDAASLSGSVDIRVAGMRDASLESVSGNVTFAGSLADGAACDIETFSGNVEVRVPADTSVTFELATYSGEIASELGGEPVRRSRATPEQELELTLGTGRAAVSVKTFSGRIRIGS